MNAINFHPSTEKTEHAFMNCSYEILIMFILEWYDNKGRNAMECFYIGCELA